MTLVGLVQMQRKRLDRKFALVDLDRGQTLDCSPRHWDGHVLHISVLPLTMTRKPRATQVFNRVPCVRLAHHRGSAPQR